MTSRARPAAAGAAASTPSGPDPPELPAAWWGMAVLIMTEGMVFAILLASYFFLRARPRSGRLGGIEAAQAGPGAALQLRPVGQQHPHLLGRGRLRKGTAGRFKAGMAISFVMGAVVPAFTLYDFDELTFGWRDNAYGVDLLHDRRAARLPRGRRPGHERWWCRPRPGSGRYDRATTPAPRCSPSTGTSSTWCGCSCSRPSSSPSTCDRPPPAPARRPGARTASRRPSGRVTVWYAVLGGDRGLDHPPLVFVVSSSASPATPPATSG